MAQRSTATLLREAAAALEDGEDPFGPHFLGEHDVESGECIDMANLMAAGARLIAWLIENPRAARAALPAMEMEKLIELMERAGW